MATSSGKNKRKLRDKCTIHILDFKYPNKEDSESLRNSITNEIVRHFGNKVFTAGQDTKSSPNEQNERSCPKTQQEKLEINHALLDFGEIQEDLLDVSLNKKYICLLLRDGTVYRASSSFIHDNHHQVIENPAKGKEDGSILLKREEPFQVASDESYARRLQRSSLYNDIVGSIQQRRSYNPLNPTLHLNNPSIYPSLSNFVNLPSGPCLHGYPLNVRFIGSPRIPFGSSSRYTPYSVAARQRRCQMGHLLSVTHRDIVQLGQSNQESQEIEDDNNQLNQMGLFNNVTVVLDNTDDVESLNVDQISVIPSEMQNTLDRDITELEVSNTMEESNSTFQSGENQPCLPNVFDTFGFSKTLSQGSNSEESVELNNANKSESRSHTNRQDVNPKSSSPSKSTEYPSFNKNLPWGSKFGNLIKGNLDHKPFVNVNAMESGFLLIDEEGSLWLWLNNESSPTKANFDWNEKDPIVAIGSNLFRATVLLESNSYVTFYDICFKEINVAETPQLIQTLSHSPMKFGELLDEEILDIQCSTFYTVVQTNSGKVFWWGLTPPQERTSPNPSRKSKSSESNEIQIGDVVASKREKNEVGCLVFNTTLQKMGIVVKYLPSEESSPQSSDKVLVVCMNRNVFELGEEIVGDLSTEWDCKNIVFLQEQNVSTGNVVSCDGNYVIVKMADSEQSNDLKVYLKTDVEKVRGDLKYGQTRYQKYLINTPVRVFNREEFTVSAVAASEFGLSFLVDRVKDHKAFLVHPSSVSNEHNKWFTCSQRDINKKVNQNDVNKKDVMKSECNVTVEYEAAPSEESRLCIKQYKSSNTLNENNTLLDQGTTGSIFDHCSMNDEKFLTAVSLTDLETKLNQPDGTPKFSRSFSMPTGGRTDSHLRKKWKNKFNVRLGDSSSKIKKPRLISFGSHQNYSCLLFDNINCLYPVQFDCSLLNPPLLEILPLKSFLVFDRGHHKDEQVLTILAVPKRSPLITAIQNGNKGLVQKAVSQLSDECGAEFDRDYEYSKRMKMSEGHAKAQETRNSYAHWLDERCNGNQNIMHVAASNILQSESKVPLLGNIMDIRNNDENAIVQAFLHCSTIWPKVRELLCERDSHGCTPFMTAIIMHNLRAADLILEAIKRDGRNEMKLNSPVDKNLFRNAICQPTFSGLTPIHALVHCSSKKQWSQKWYRTLKVSTLMGASPRLLLGHFKSKYPSAYRAIMPVPEPQWYQRSVRKRLNDDKVKEPVEVNSQSGKGKAKMTPQPRSRRRMFHGAQGASSHHIQASRSIHEKAKDGLVMFGDINEMYQALSEIYNDAILWKADNRSGTTLRMVQQFLQVELYQERLHSDASTAMLSQINNTSGTTPKQPVYSIDQLMRRENSMEFPQLQKYNTPSATTEISPQLREQTINKCFDDIMVHLLMTSLVTADPNILSCVNGEGDTALSYFLNTYPRYSPSHLHKLFLNWRPCNNTSCKYNRHTGKIKITCNKDIEPIKTEKEEKKSSTVDDEQKFSLSPSPSIPSQQGRNRKVLEVHPILARRGLQNRTGSLTLNVRDQANMNNDYASSPITPSIRVIDNLKFAPIEVQSVSGLTPQIQQPNTSIDPSNNPGSSRKFQSSNLSPFFPTNVPQPESARVPVINSGASSSGVGCSSSGSSLAEGCMCHLNKPRLLWNTTFQASIFYLAKNWPCIVSSVMCSQSNASLTELDFVDCNKLDIFTENILLNPYVILLEVFVKTLTSRFLESKVSQNAILLPTLHRLNPINQDYFTGKTFNGLLPWLTVHRFVRSLVRQLSLSLSKNTSHDGSLVLRFDRNASKSDVKKEARMKEHLKICLQAFSWISVIEILKAATAMLKPIRMGTVKALPKGIIREIHPNIEPFSRRSIPAGLRMHVPTGGSSGNHRTHLSNIRHANRRNPQYPAAIPGNASSMLSGLFENATATTIFTPPRPSTSAAANKSAAPGSSKRPSNSAGSSSNFPMPGPSNITEEEMYSEDDEEETINIDDPFIFSPDNANVQNLERNDSTNDLGEIPLSNTQQLASDSFAWALDGHIQSSREYTQNILPMGMFTPFNYQRQQQQQIMNTPSIHAGFLYLSRMFCRLVKEAVDIAAYLNKEKNHRESDRAPGLFKIEPLSFTEDVEKALRNEANGQLTATWGWMKEILTTLENQLRLGEEFDTKHYILRLKRTTQPEIDLPGMGRTSTMTNIYGSTPDEYMMYLLREEMGEGSNSLPVLDLFSFNHLMFVLDAYLYMNRFDPFMKQPSAHNQNKVNPSTIATDPKDQRFFNPVINLCEAVNDEKVKRLRQHVMEKLSIANQIFVWLDETVLKKQKQKKEDELMHTGGEQWNRVMEAFSTLFLSIGPRYERDSFLAVKAGAFGRMARFQSTLTSLRPEGVRTFEFSAQGPILMIHVLRPRLLADCINFFSENMDSHPYSAIKVRFEGEEGTGPGVNRGLFASFATALKTEKYMNWPIPFFAECGQMPAQQGIFSPTVGKYLLQDTSRPYFVHNMSQEKRHTAFMAIGRFFGFSLWFNHTVPFVLSRPVLLYLLGKEADITFDDLAFYDSSLYKSYSELLAHALSSSVSEKEFEDTFDLTFEVTVDQFHIEEIIPDGKNQKVTKKNAIEYIRLCAQHKMVTSREDELQALREGFHQIIPKELLESLEAEDLQLLLSGGVEDVSYTRLRSIITFSNSRGTSRQSLERYKKWFWGIVLKMTSSERRKLLYFATGSSVLPAMHNKIGSNSEEVSITVDIINSPNSSALPMSSTCGQRISMPLYHTKAILRAKLLQAIECQSYGLG